MTCAVLLINPKFPHNVGGALRACAAMGGDGLYWTGDRVPPPDAWPEGSRLPREERMKAYERVHVRGDADPHNELDRGFLRGLTPVCVEVRDTSMSLVDYVHPEDAVYVFGPEDGTLGKGITTACHEFIRIPTVGCLNLSAAVNVVLYDRMAKQTKTAEALLYEMHRREHGELMGA